MDWITALASYFVIWWISLFLVLPFGVKKNTDDTPGIEAGAPEKSMIGRKMLINSVLALVLFLVFWGIVESDVISFREMAKE